MKFKPLHDRLLLKPTVAETKTKSGIIIPDTAQEKPMQGEVDRGRQGQAPGRRPPAAARREGRRQGHLRQVVRHRGQDCWRRSRDPEGRGSVRRPRLTPMLKPGDSQRVAELMRETAAAELLPRFRNLAKEDVRQKRPGDFVTVADVASEQRLASGLAKILPGVPVVGEEAVERRRRPRRADRPAGRDLLGGRSARRDRQLRRRPRSLRHDHLPDPRP